MAFLPRSFVGAALFAFTAFSSLLAAVVAAPRQAAAQETSANAAATPATRPFAYGILVGSNAGGPGQQPLRFAEDDARKMADVLRQLGRYGTADLRVLSRPDGAAVLAAIDAVAAKLRVHEQKGEQTVLVFYYSGHAKANAFNLGAEELPIATLRKKLDALPTQLTLVVLDACQSGQFARVKGTEPAADFSFNSVSRLTTKGIAVMASSTAEELSQESDELKSSYFTHHLTVGLRGAADADGDGRVSLDEAYRYAYRRTLTSTAQTQVGTQHVTLETDLQGQGDVPVTYPADAKSQLELPGALDARVLVQHQPSGSVVAEIQKAKGAPIRLAFAAGAYEALVRSPGKVVRCRLSLADTRVTLLDVGACESVKLTGVAKGDGARLEPDILAGGHRRALAPWEIEVGAGFLVRQEDAFTRRLQEFGYREQDALVKPPRLRAHVGFSKGILPHLSVGAHVHTLGGDTYERDASDSADSFTWDAYGASVFVRGSTVAIGRNNDRSSYVELYGQLGGGLALGFTTLNTGSQRLGRIQESNEMHVGYVLGGFGGMAFMLPRTLGLFVQGGYEYAPVVANLVGDIQNAGGPSVQLGARLRFE